MSSAFVCWRGTFVTRTAKPSLVALNSVEWFFSIIVYWLFDLLLLTYIENPNVEYKTSIIATHIFNSINSLLSASSTSFIFLFNSISTWFLRQIDSKETENCFVTLMLLNACINCFWLLCCIGIMLQTNASTYMPRDELYF